MVYVAVLHAHVSLCEAHARIVHLLDITESSQGVQKLYPSTVYIADQNKLKVIVDAQDGDGSVSFEENGYFIRSGTSRTFVLDFGEKLSNTGDSILTLFIE